MPLRLSTAEAVHIGTEDDLWGAPGPVGTRRTRYLLECRKIRGVRQRKVRITQPLPTCSGILSTMPTSYKCTGYSHRLQIASRTSFMKIAITGVEGFRRTCCARLISRRQRLPEFDTRNFQRTVACLFWRACSMAIVGQAVQLPSEEA